MITSWTQSTDTAVSYPHGFTAASARCGLKTEGNDLALIVSEQVASVAGVFTTNVVKASCVTHSQKVVQTGTARAILCNAGNANACNGDQGDRDTKEMAALAAAELGCSEGDILVASTGVIGHLLPMEKLRAGIPLVAGALQRGPKADQYLSRAIMTTDTRPKRFSAALESDQFEGQIRFGGVCKGAGMIAPNMATMLCFLTTDVKISPELLKRALLSAVNRTFNRMTIDGDTSTNDMTLVLASGAGTAAISAVGPDYDDFVEGLERVCRHLAREVARDGEGATKLVDVVVRGAESEEDAVKIARTISESPLVKTALYGNDPNWGRLLMAAGRAGVEFDPRKIEVFLGPHCVCRQGGSIEFDREAASRYLRSKEVEVIVDLHSGAESATFFTCDYSYDYIKINADYHT